MSLERVSFIKRILSGARKGERDSVTVTMTTAEADELLRDTKEHSSRKDDAGVKYVSEAIVERVLA